MKVSELKNLFPLTEVQGEFEDKEITAVYTSDLLSDVLANADDNALLVTIQAHKNTLAVATVKDSPAIIVCNGREIPEDMIEAAKTEKIALFSTEINQYEVSGKLFCALNGK